MLIAFIPTHLSSGVAQMLVTSLEDEGSANFFPSFPLFSQTTAPPSGLLLKGESDLLWCMKEGEAGPPTMPSKQRSPGEETESGRGGRAVQGRAPREVGNLQSAAPQIILLRPSVRFPNSIKKLKKSSLKRSNFPVDCLRQPRVRNGLRGRWPVCRVKRQEEGEELPEAGRVPVGRDRVEGAAHDLENQSGEGGGLKGASRRGMRGFFLQ